MDAIGRNTSFQTTWPDRVQRRFLWMLVGVSILFLATEVIASLGVVPHLQPVSIEELSSNILFAIGFGCPIVLYLSSLPRLIEVVTTVLLGLLLSLALLAIWIIRREVDIAQWRDYSETVAAHVVTGMGVAFLARLLWDAWRKKGVERSDALLFLLPASVALLVTLQAGIFWYYLASLFPTTYDSYAFALDEAYGFSWSFAIGQLFQAFPLLAAICTAIYLAPPPALIFVYALQVRSRRKPPVDVVTILLVLLLAGYGLFFLFPVCGPLFAFGKAFPDSPPTVHEFAGQRMEVVTAQPAPRNGMPSLHMASAIIAYWHARPYGRWARRVAGVFVVGTFLATMGVGEHYFIDLLVALPFTLAIHAACTPSLPELRKERAAAFFGATALVVFWYLLLFFGIPVLLSSRTLTWVVTIVTVLAVVFLERRLYQATEALSNPE
jgi:hypothetical protein